MPELTWVGKDKVITHHLDVPYRVLDRQYSFDETGQHEADNGSENMIIHGDNLEALKALLPKYEGKVDCIYIDPPYNTGNEGWVYNDNVNDPRIKKWLGEVVGKEGEDLSRHDKWLCMMYPRLRMLAKLLSPTGVLVISLSYHELSNLLGILNEIFSSRQIVTTTVQTSGGKPSGGFNYVHEYLVFVTPREFSPKTTDYSGGKTRTPFEGLTLATFDQTQRPNQTYPIFINTETLSIEGVGPSLQELIDRGEYRGDKAEYTFHQQGVPDGCVAVWPITSKGKACVWRQIPTRLLHDWTKGYIKTSRVGDRISIQYLPAGVIKKINSGDLKVIGREPGAPTLKFGENSTAGTQISTIYTNKSFYTVKGTGEFEAIFNDRPKSFNYPKPVDLVQFVVESVTPENGIVLDSFAGSGTTAHAVLRSNREKGSNRSFILIELSEYADSLTAERVRRVSKGYYLGEEPVIGTGGSFSFYELGVPLLVDGNLNPEVPLEQVREYIWFTDTGEAYQPGSGQAHPDYLGRSSSGTSYFFAFDAKTATALDQAYLASIPTECAAESYVIYADTCLLTEQQLLKHNITFKKIPRDIIRL